jgi:hypothetical protein
MIKLLLDYLLQAPGKPAERLVAVCLTKADLLAVPEIDPWQQVGALFGAESRSMLQTFKDHPGLKLEAFATSAAGFLTGSDKTPNYRDGDISDKNQWQPWNVEAPFFWILERLERQRMGINSNHWLMRWLFARARRKLYLGYPSALTDETKAVPSPAQNSTPENIGGR